MIGDIDPSAATRGDNPNRQDVDGDGHRTDDGNDGIGASTLRVEDERHLRGKALFAADPTAPGTLQVAFVRSIEAHGVIHSIDTAQARTVDGVIGVYTARELDCIGALAVNPVIEGAVQTHFELLASERVLAVGQPVAMVIATSAAAAAQASEEVAVLLESRTPQLSGRSIGQPPLFAQHPNNLAFEASWHSRAPSEGKDENDGSRGDTGMGSGSVPKTGPAPKTAPLVEVEVTVQHPRLAAMAMEPRAATAIWDDEACALDVWLSTQTPHRSRTDIATMLGMDVANVRVRAVDVGGAFGAKASIYPEEVLVCWAAKQHRLPCQWVSTRGEEMLSATHGRGIHTTGALQLHADGRFEHLDAVADAPLGHWLPFSAVIPAWNAIRILPGPYRVANFDLQTRAHVSNSAPVGIYRGAGRPEAAMLLERLVDNAARALNIDPLLLRAINLLRSDELPLLRNTGARLDSGDFLAALNQLRETARYDDLRTSQSRRRVNGELVGIGIACYVEPCGTGWESARVTLSAEGSVTVDTGGTAQGQGRETAFAQIASSVLDVPAACVTVRHGDTQCTPAGIGALASRSTAIGGSALEQAARQVRERAARHNWNDGAVVEEVIYHAEAEAWGFGTTLVMLSVDPDTGVITIEKALAIDDIGIEINPALVAGQVIGGFAQGLGEALMESIVYDDDGQLLTGSLLDYAVPRATDMPTLELATRHTVTSANRLGTRGVGEAGTIGAPAALTNAVLDALAPLGIDDVTMPMSPHSLWQVMDAARRAAP
jgi:carbon-monoxide dehydrogenase large subunit